MDSVVKTFQPKLDSIKTASRAEMGRLLTPISTLASRLAGRTMPPDTRPSANARSHPCGEVENDAHPAFQERARAPSRAGLLGRPGPRHARGASIPFARRSRSPSRTGSRPSRRAARCATPESSVRAAPRLFPSLNFTMGQVNQSGDRFDNQGRLVPYLAPQPRGATAPASSSTITVFDGGRRLGEIRRTRYDVGATEANEVSQRFNLALQVKTQYYSTSLRASPGRGPCAARAGGGADEGVDRPHPGGSPRYPIRSAPSSPSATRSSR